MDRFHEMEVFAAVAAAGSFARAARELRLSPPAVTRAVSSLEDRLGVRLINRTTRSLSLTEAGQRFQANCDRLLGELEAAERDAVGDAGIVQGHLNLTASVTLGRFAIAPVLGEFLAAHPRLTATMTLLDRVAHLVDEGFDAGIRIGALPDSSLIAKRIGQVRRVMVASPTYIASRGTPKDPADLRLHSLIGFTGLTAARELSFDDGSGTKKVALSPRLEINDAAAAIASAEAGHGITTSLCYMVGASIRAKRLVPVLETYWPAPVPVQIVYPHSRLLAAKVRAFVDWGTDRLASQLPQLSDFEVPD